MTRLICALALLALAGRFVWYLFDVVNAMDDARAWAMLGLTATLVLSFAAAVAFGHWSASRIE